MYKKIYPENNALITSCSLLINEDCNLACKYCFEKHNPQKMDKDTANQAVDFLFSNAKKTIGKKEVGITFFGGEPTLSPDIMEVVFKRCIYNREITGIPFSTMIITNATIMTSQIEELFETYKHSCNFSVQLSVDGIKEVQDMYRVTKSGKGTYDIVARNIPIYKRIFRDKAPSSLSIHGCVNKKSLPYMFENYLHFREDLGLSHIWFLPVCEEQWDESDVNIYETQLNRIYNYIMSRVKDSGKISEIENYAPLDRGLKPLCGVKGAPCGAGKNYSTITATGDLYPCHQIYYNDPEMNTWFGDVWKGVDDNRRRLFLEYDSRDLSCPSDCDHDFCYRCIAVNYVWNGSILEQMRGHYCSMMKIDKKYQDKIRGELKTMGLLNSNRNEQVNSNCGVVSNNPDCMCDMRGNSREVFCGKVSNNPDCLCDSRATSKLNDTVKRLIRTEDGENGKKYGVYLMNSGVIDIREINEMQTDSQPIIPKSWEDTKSETPDKCACGKKCHEKKDADTFISPDSEIKVSSEEMRLLLVCMKGVMDKLDSIEMQLGK